VIGAAKQVATHVVQSGRAPAGRTCARGDGHGRSGLDRGMDFYVIKQEVLAQPRPPVIEARQLDDLLWQPAFCKEQ